MTTEPKAKKPWEKDPIPKAEWVANKAAVQLATGQGDGLLRQKVKDGFARIIGRAKDPRRQSTGMAAYLVAEGYLQKPDWHDKSTLVMDHFTTEELLDAYNWLKTGIAPDREEEEDDNPF